MECSQCGHQASLTAGTIFDNTKTPLRIWFRAAWLMTSSRYGVNAVTLQEQLGFGSYQTAWAWLHKFRRAMIRPDRDRLSGLIEVDETFVGGDEEGAIGRQTNSKCLVAVAAEAAGLLELEMAALGVPAVYIGDFHAGAPGVVAFDS